MPEHLELFRMEYLTGQLVCTWRFAEACQRQGFTTPSQSYLASFNQCSIGHVVVELVGAGAIRGSRHTAGALDHAGARTLLFGDGVAEPHIPV